MVRVKINTIIDMQNVGEFIVTQFRNVVNYMFNNIIFTWGDNAVSLGDLLITLILLSIFLRIILTIRGNNMYKLDKAMERRGKK